VGGHFFLLLATVVPLVLAKMDQAARRVIPFYVVMISWFGCNSDKMLEYIRAERLHALKSTNAGSSSPIGLSSQWPGIHE
jgi:hypothetical protein